MSEEQSKPKAVRYLLEADDGTLVSVPADKLSSWMRGQEEVRNGTYKPDERLISRIVSRLMELNK